MSNSTQQTSLSALDHVVARVLDAGQRFDFRGHLHLRCIGTRMYFAAWQTRAEPRHDVFVESRSFSWALNELANELERRIAEREEEAASEVDGEVWVAGD